MAAKYSVISCKSSPSGSGAVSPVLGSRDNYRARKPDKEACQLIITRHWTTFSSFVPSPSNVVSLNLSSTPHSARLCPRLVHLIVILIISDNLISRDAFQSRHSAIPPRISAGIISLPTTDTCPATAPLNTHAIHCSRCSNTHCRRLPNPFPELRVCSQNHLHVLNPPRTASIPDDPPRPRNTRPSRATNDHSRHLHRVARLRRKQRLNFSNCPRCRHWRRWLPARQPRP